MAFCGRGLYPEEDYYVLMMMRATMQSRIFTPFSLHYVFLHSTGYMLLYLVSLQMMFRAFVFLIPMEKTASALAGFVLLLTTLVNGVMLHQRDFPFYVKWLEYVSPSRWVMPELLQRELSEMALRNSISKEMRCTNKQVSYQPIFFVTNIPKEAIL